MKFKKIFLGILAALSIFTFIGCKKGQNEKDTIEKIRESILKSERFNFHDFKFGKKSAYLKKISTNEVLESDKKLPDNDDILYELDNINKKHIFRNITNGKKFELDAEKFTFANSTSSNYILVYDKDNTYYFLSRLDGKILLEVKDGTLTTNPDHNLITQKNIVTTYNRRHIDLVRTHKVNTHDYKYYYFYNFELVKDVEKFQKEVFENEKNGVHVNATPNNATITKDGKFYDFINFNTLIDKFFLLENNNILFKTKKKLSAGFNANKNNTDIKNYYIDGGRAYLYNTYLYDFKKKELKKINLPFIVNSVIANKKDKEGKPFFSNSRIKNLVSISMIDPETRKLSSREYVVADNYFAEIIKITSQSPQYVSKVAENRYLVNNEGYKYSLIDKKGNEIRNFPSKNVIAKHYHYLVVNNSGDPISNTNYKVDIYDLLEGKYIAKNYYLPKTTYGIEDEENVFYNENYEPVLLVNNVKNPLLKVKGKTWDFDKSNYQFRSVKDGTKLYIYHRNGEFIAEIPDLNKFDIYNLKYQTYSNLSDPYSDYTEYTLISYTSSDNKNHYVTVKREYSYKLEK